MIWANGTFGFGVVDVPNPSNTVKVASVNDGGTACGVAVSGQYALLANLNDGLRIYAVEPQLQINLSGGDSLQFLWPAPAPFVLQQNSGLNPSNWTKITNLPVSDAGWDQLTLPKPVGDWFYRLKSD